MRESSIPEEVCKVLDKVVGQTYGELHEPYFSKDEEDMLIECLKSTFVSSVSPYTEKFEEDIARFTGSKYVVAVSNGTSALHSLLIACGIGPGMEVLTPSLTFVAAANAISYTGAIPHFIEVEEKTLGIDTVKVIEYLSDKLIRSGEVFINKETGRKVVAIVPLHTFGHPCDIDGVMKIAKEFNLLIIEDSAESLGSYFRQKHTGTFGLGGILSFNGNKIITTGGGGAVITDDEELASRVKHLTRTAKIPHKWEYNHDLIGFNYRMPGLNSSLGLSQLRTIEKKIEAKRKLYQVYEKEFANIEEVEIFKEPSSTTSNYWLQTLLLKKDNVTLRNAILETSHKWGYKLRPAWTPMHRLLQFSNCPKMELNVTDSLFARIINLPSSPQIVLSRLDN